VLRYHPVVAHRARRETMGELRKREVGAIFNRTGGARGGSRSSTRPKGRELLGSCRSRSPACWRRHIDGEISAPTKVADPQYPRSGPPLLVGDIDATTPFLRGPGASRLARALMLTRIGDDGPILHETQGARTRLPGEAEG